MGYILEFKKWKHLNEDNSYFNKEKGGKFSHLFNTALLIMDKLVTQYKYSPKLAAALCGNMFSESKLNPNTKSSDGYYGLIQWGDPRLPKLKKLPNWQTIDGQLKFIDIELNGPYFTKVSPVKSLITADISVEDAASIITKNYERTTPSAQSKAERRNGAREIYDAYIAKQAASSNATTSTTPQSTDQQSTSPQ